MASVPSMDVLREFEAPPAVDVGHNTKKVLDTDTQLHHLAVKRMANGRDLKIIITAEDSETGVGKTTAAGWLAMNWTWMFSQTQWNVEDHATLSPDQYFYMTRKLPKGTVIVVDDAEELDARRSMQNMNVKFSWWWMLMRLKQIFTILTLPSPASIDSRLEELADVWINVTRRGQGICHDIGVQSYGTRDVTTEKVHKIDFPDVSNHDQMQALQKMKREKMDKWEREMHGEMEEEDDSLGKTPQTFLAMAVKEREGLPWVDVPDVDDRLEYSGEFYRKQSKELLA